MQKLNRSDVPSLYIDRLKPRVAAALFAAAAALIAAPSHASATGLTIVPTFDSSITSDPNAGTIEASINDAISRIESYIADPITVPIYFESMNSGLGESETGLYATDYPTYRSFLAGNQLSLSADDNVALASLPVQTANPVHAGNDVAASSALLRALGQNTPPVLMGSGGASFDGAIGINTSICNLSRTGTQNPSFYDIEAVVGHEMDEVLGIGGVGSYLSSADSSPPTDYVGVLDLFRYKSPGVRSFTLDSTQNAYFSIDGGNTNFVYFDQNNEGADFGDWGNGTPDAEAGNTPPQVQDAFGTPGVDVNVGANELAALDVVGYTLTAAGAAIEAAVPEPTTAATLFAAVTLLATCRRRR